VAQALASEQDWALRSSAAEALGRIAAKSSDAKATAALSSAASSDPYALVRERAAQALWAVNPGAARAVLERLAQNDEEPAVKSTARKLLSGEK
jgi:HEAT repeat protein